MYLSDGNIHTTVLNGKSIISAPSESLDHWLEVRAEAVLRKCVRERKFNNSSDK